MTDEHRRENAAASLQRASQELAIARNCCRDGFFHVDVARDAIEQAQAFADACGAVLAARGFA